MPYLELITRNGLVEILEGEVSKYNLLASNEANVTGTLGVLMVARIRDHLFRVL